MDSAAITSIELCAGVGMLGEGVAAGLRYLGIDSRCILYAEREAYPCAVLEARMEEGSLASAPIWCGDFTELPASRFRGVVDIVVAGFPCQDLSIAGRRAGLDGARSGLFFSVVDIADACGAWGLVLENVAGIASATAAVVDEAEGELEERAAARVMGELADRGWDAEWITLSASDVGASHGRARWFCFAWRMADPTRHVGHGLDGQGRCGRGICAAGDTVAHPERAERRQIGIGGIGSVEGDDSGRREEDRRSGIADAVLGHPDNGDRSGDGLRTGPQHAESVSPNSPMADAKSDLGRSKQPTRSEGGGRAGLAGIGAELADTSSPGQQGSELGRTRDSHWGGAGNTWTN